MEYYNLIGKQVYINDRNAKIEDINGNKVSLIDEYGEELVVSLKTIENLKPIIKKELLSLKFNTLDNVSVYYYDNEDLKFVNCHPNDWEELEEFLELENIEYKGDVRDYVNANEDHDKLTSQLKPLEETDIENIEKKIIKLGYKLTEKENSKLTFTSKSKIEVKLLFESQIQKFFYNEFNRIDDVLMELEDIYQRPIIFDLHLTNNGKFKLVIECK